VARAVRAKVQGERPTRIASGERRVGLLLRLQEADRAGVADLRAINVNPALIPPVRLDTVAVLEEGEGPSEVRRLDQRRAVVLAADVDGFDLSGAARAALGALERAGLPDGVEVEVAGQNRELETSLRSLSYALLLAVFLVYVIMASTFESFRDPLVILFSVPLALVGVALGLWVTSTPVSVVVFIGLIVLAGVVVANAIVLVDAIGRLRSEGHALDAAIREAAALRLRPILITALNSVLGLVPLAVGFGEGQEMQRPLAITIIFGLASSTVLTLVVVPVIYRLAARFTEGTNPEAAPS
jgi:HAE1 family hydrophobic/amphiphilic exporter-1